MPDIQFHQPDNVLGTKPEELSWWHVAISSKYWFFNRVPLSDVSCTLLIEGNREAELCFRPLQGSQPEHRIALHWGDTRYIPICARATTDNFPLGFSAPYVLIHGQLAKGWVLKRGIARITDGNHYFTFGNLINLTGPVNYNLTLQLKLGKRVYVEKQYILEIPNTDSDNGSFLLKDKNSK